MDIKKLGVEVEKFLNSINYDLYDIKYIKKKKNSILRIYIDSDKDINVDDCVTVTQQINPFLDELDPIQDAYMLEVSSPGAEKILKNEKAIKKAIGKFVHVETYEQKFEGILDGFNGDVVSLSIRNKKIDINYIDVNLIRLAIKF